MPIVSIIWEWWENFVILWGAWKETNLVKNPEGLLEVEFEDLMKVWMKSWDWCVEKGLLNEIRFHIDTLQKDLALPQSIMWFVIVA